MINTLNQEYGYSCHSLPCMCSCNFQQKDWTTMTGASYEEGHFFHGGEAFCPDIKLSPDVSGLTERTQKRFSS